MGWDQFSTACQDYSTEDMQRFTEAYSLAEQELQDKKRISGEPFVEHAVRVATILAENKAAAEVIIAGLLHSCLNSTTTKDIKSLFGEEVLALIQGEQQIKQLKSKNKQLAADALRKIMLMTVKDVRIILIKLAIKLDNLRTIDVLPPEEQKRIAIEVLEMYAPLASRLGVESIKIQLEDLALKVLHPDTYAQIAHFLEQSSEEREKDIDNAVRRIKNVLGNKVPIIRMKGRPKHIYSIYKKMTLRKVPLDEQYDLFGIRIIVSTVADCYTVLGLLHENFEPMEGRLKDYIAHPKPNLYQSIHTGIHIRPDKMVEVQIRTPEMDEVSEEGIAAHWKYKGIKSDQAFEKKTAWLRSILDLQQEDKELLESAKVDIFGDTITCYTPKGDSKELPLQSTVLDFAYAVHEEVGNHAVGASVNGKFVPLKHELKMGDVIEILTNKNQRPRRGWLKIVISGKSKQKIRKSLKEHEKLAVTHYRTLRPSIQEDQGILIESSEYPAAICLLAKCCLPLPGEEIIGIVTKRRIISAHTKTCRAALKEEDRWVVVNWKKEFNQKIRFFIRAEERRGLLADLLHTIVQAGFEVKEAKARFIDAENAECSFLVIPRDLEHLMELVQRLRKVKSVKKVYFE